jgi:hypothetical protein
MIDVSWKRLHTQANWVGDILTSGLRGKKQLSVPSTLGISVCIVTIVRNGNQRESLVLTKP